MSQNTHILSNDNPQFQQELNQQANRPIGTATLGEQREVILLIRGMPERLMFRQHTAYTLGRFNMNTDLTKEVDLTPYGAADRGVSRLHARVHMEDNRLYITDLDSTNGTFLAGKRLQPHQPMLLHKGDELMIGRLQVQFMFH